MRPVALPERVQGVDVAQRLGQAGDEAVEVTSAQDLLGVEATEDVGGEGLEVWGRQNSCPLPMDTVRSCPA